MNQSSLSVSVAQTQQKLAYNATVVSIRFVHDELMILTVASDDPYPDFEPGQYTTLGLGSWKPRCDGVSNERTNRSLIRRAYSMSSPMWDRTTQTIVRQNGLELIEFYIVKINRPSDDPPPLTPRLFALKVGDRLHLGMKPRGRYTLRHVSATDDVILLATGTGEAPHNAMIAELLSHHHSGRIVAMSCVRKNVDLGYLNTHRELERHFFQYRYIPLTTREPENLDPSQAEYVGKQYLQDYWIANRFEKELGWTPEPATSHVYLCGNPKMLGNPSRDAHGDLAFPETLGMIEILTRRGFQLDQPRQPGNIHVEKYW